MSIRAVVFDLDDTLSNFTQGENQARIRTSQLLAEKTGIPKEVLSDTFLKCAAPLLAYETSGLWVKYTQKEFNTIIWQKVFNTLRIEEDATYWARVHVHTRDMVLSLFPDVLPMLKELQFVPKGLISNGPADNQRHETDILKIGKYFQSQQYEGELGFGKPDERIFKLVETELGFSGQSLVMVGDSLHTDILGAHRVGWKSIWLNRKSSDRPDDSPKPDESIKTLSELMKVLNLWGLFQS